MGNIADKNYINMIKGFLFLAPFLIGGYHIWTSCIYTVLLLFLLIYKRLKFDIQFSKTVVSYELLSVFVVCLAYLVSTIWAVDSGTAIYGFFKFLPLPLFALCIYNLDLSQKKDLLCVMPYSAATMGALSLALSFVPSLKDYFLVASRLGGFFQYPNTFALFCLLGIIISMLSGEIKNKDWLISLVLFVFILRSGSRSVFVLSVLVGIVIFIRISNKNRLKLVLGTVGVLGVTLIIVALTDNMQTLGRFLTISVNSSTLLGRLLYYVDALPVILRHPFGLGYYGYYFMQGSFQTGVYSVAFIHNDLLQLLLDVGWIPAILTIAMLIKTFMSKNSSFLNKLLLAIIVLHSMVDFNLQFVSIGLIFVLLIDYDTRSLFSFSVNKLVLGIVASVVALLSIYFGVVNVMFLTGNYDKVDSFYGRDTQSEIELMTNEQDYNKIDAYAKSILARNKYISVAYSARANDYLSRGRVKEFIQFKQKAIENNRYSVEEYRNYLDTLIYCANVYRQNGALEDARYCETKYLEVVEKMNSTINGTNSLGWKIKDKPELSLTPDEQKYLDFITK